MNTCWRCKKEIDGTDNFCRRCGAGQGSHVPWHYRLWGILFLTFCLGPLALPYVIRSPLLSKTAKWVLSVLIIIFTIVLVVLVYVAIKRTFDMVNAALSGNLDSF